LRINNAKPQENNTTCNALKPFRRAKEKHPWPTRNPPLYSFNPTIAVQCSFVAQITKSPKLEQILLTNSTYTIMVHGVAKRRISNIT